MILFSRDTQIIWVWWTETQFPDHSNLSIIIPLLPSSHSSLKYLPCLPFISFQSPSEPHTGAEVLPAVHSVEPPMSRDFHFHHSPLFFPGSAVTLPLKSYPFLEGVLPSPLLLNKCIFDENLHTSCRKLNMEITHKSSDLDMQWHSYPAQDRPKVKPQM